MTRKDEEEEERGAIGEKRMRRERGEVEQETGRGREEG